MTNEALLDPQTQKIIKRYTTLYKLIFQYSIFFIPLILAILWGFSLQSSEALKTILPTPIKFDSYTNNNGIYKAIKVSDQVGPIFDGKGEVKILWWLLQATGNTLIGKNNLITVDGIILPNKPYIIDFWFTGNLETFNKSYALSDLKWVLDHWILSNIPTEAGSTGVVDTMFFQPDDNSLQWPTANIPNTSNTVKRDLIEEYNLGCINKRKLYNGFCNTNITYFLQQLPTIKLDGAWVDLETIASRITNDEQKQSFCANIMTNFLKQPRTSSELDELMARTCSEYNNRYSAIKDFLKVQNELNSIVSEALITNNLDINLFKLTSLRQKIALQNTSKGVDTTTVISYLKFLDALIHQGNFTIPQFYIDTAYYFNNAYLKTMLKSLSVGSLNPTVKSEVNTIVEQINTINKWNLSLGIKWLDKMITNPETIQIINTTSGSLFTSFANFEQVFKDTMQSYPEVRITNIQTDEASKTARIVAVMRYFNEEKVEKAIPMIAQFDYKGNQFVVSSVRTPQNTLVDALLTTYMANHKDAWFGVILDVIKDNIDYNNTNISLCDIFKAQNGVDVWSCTESRSSVTINNTVITFTLNNNSVTKASTANSLRQTYLDNLLKNWPITKDTIWSTLQAIINLWKINTPDEIGSVDTEKISIVGKFKSFLWVEPSAVVFRNNKWFATFELKGYSFATVIAIDKNYKLAPLVVQINNKIITISNFSLSLIPFSQTRITQFIDDPMDYIKSIDLKAYNEIQTAKDAK